MRLSLGLILLFFIFNALAGGIRGAYERMSIWYAYQANIDLLEGYLKGTDKLNVNKLEICSGKSGSGRHGTMNFEEFILFTNRDAKGVVPAPRRGWNLPQSSPTYYDRTAQNLVDKRAMSHKWYGTRGIIKSAKSYVNLLPEVSGAPYKFGQSLPGNNINVRNSRLCVEKVVQTRRVDYDLYRIPAMKASAEFKDLKIEPYELVLGTKKGSSTAVLDLDAVAADNNLNAAAFQQKVNDWEDNVFPKDPIYGLHAKGHAGSLRASKEAFNLANTGTC
ncbi:hypothetical protein FVER14953_20616 [Fusarium verticillioides]|nr:hypothetical protein FVER14953_20616 [Fusarium verticillioides]